MATVQVCHLRQHCETRKLHCKTLRASPAYPVEGGWTNPCSRALGKFKLSSLILAVFGYTFKLFWPGTCSKRSEMAEGFTWTDFQPKPSILDPFRSILMLLARLGNLVWAKAWLGEPRRGLDLPARPADSGTFFSAPFRNFFLQVFRRISREFLK